MSHANPSHPRVWTLACGVATYTTLPSSPTSFDNVTWTLYSSLIVQLTDRRYVSHQILSYFASPASQIPSLPLTNVIFKIPTLISTPKARKCFGELVPSQVQFENAKPIPVSPTCCSVISADFPKVPVTIERWLYLSGVCGSLFPRFSSLQLQNIFCLRPLLRSI